MTRRLLCLLLLFPVLFAQGRGTDRVLRGTVRTISGEAVEGAVVALAEGGETVAAYGITDGAGRFSVGH